MAPGAFLGTVRALPFILQAGQALKSLTGYGIVLGGVMGAITDTGWGLVRGALGGSVRVEGPPPSDPLGKAVRYLLQPAYHAAHGQLFTFEEHMLLAYADSIAAQIVMAAAGPELLSSRWPEMEQAPVIEFAPWTPESIAGLQDIGYVDVGTYATPMDDLSFRPTYGQALTSIAARHDGWWSEVAADFPRTVAAQDFASVVSETGKAILEWMAGAPGSIVPIFDPEEIALARMFEVGVFPKGDPYPELLGEYVERALAIAKSVGRDLPAREDVIAALDDTFGGHVES
jgi:hypothetical protein